MDETQPLLPEVTTDQQPKHHDKNVVDFDPDGDSENPQDWPQAYKWGIVALLAFMAFTVCVPSHSFTLAYTPRTAF
jgi:hypothetical protein